MFRLPYVNAVTRMVCVELAKYHKKKFTALFRQEKLRFNTRDKKVEVELFSLVGEKSVEDFVLCAMSFAAHVGTPKKWILYSDGTILDSTFQKLKAMFPFLEMLPWDYYRESVRDAKLDRYVDLGFIFAKKLYMIIGHKANGQTIYTDSDIVFYKNAGLFFDHHLFDKGIWCCAEAIYLPLKHTYNYDNDTLYHVNAGFFIFNESINFQPVYDFFHRLKEEELNHFSELKGVEYMLKQQKYTLLDPRLFVIETNDQFDFGFYYKRDTIAYRHFITPVRHKMWQYGYRWHFES